jgi:hypothetical protein
MTFYSLSASVSTLIPIWEANCRANHRIMIGRDRATTTQSSLLSSSNAAFWAYADFATVALIQASQLAALSPVR